MSLGPRTIKYRILYAGGPIELERLVSDYLHDDWETEGGLIHTSELWIQVMRWPAEYNWGPHYPDGYEPYYPLT